MREVRSVRERDTERVRRKWRHLSSAEISEEVCTFPCQNAEIGDTSVRIFWTVLLLIEKMNQITVCICYSVGLWFSKSYHYNRCIITNDVQRLRSNREPFFQAWAYPWKYTKLILKTIGNRKGDCAWSCSRWQTQPEKICKSQRTNQCHSLRTFYWFVLCNLQIFSGCVCHLEQLHAQSPFLFPIVFSINLIPFFDISSVLAVHSPGLFGYVLLYFTWATARSQELLFVVLACHELRALDSSCRLRTRRRVCICIGSMRCRGNHMHNHSRFQRDIDDVTGVSLSLSLLLTKVTHAQYRKRFRASYNTKFHGV